MSVIDAEDDGADDHIGTAGGAARPASLAPQAEPRLRTKRTTTSNRGRLRPMSIHIFEDLEKSGVLPTETLSSYKCLARDERLSRTMRAINAVDSGVAARLFASSSSRPKSMFDLKTSCSSPVSSPNSSSAAAARDAAARCLQRHFRGVLGRRLYAARLYEVYAEEEERQRREIDQKLEEAELLVEEERMKVEMEEFETVQRNAKRLLVSRVITIQRAWRRHRAQQVASLPVLGESRLDRCHAGAASRPAPPPSSISCDALAESAMGGGSGASNGSSVADSFRPFDRETIRLRLASEDDDDRRGRQLPTSKSLFADENFHEVSLNDIPEDDDEVEATTTSSLEAASASEPLPTRHVSGFDSAHERLRLEARIQLARAAPLARLQMELEKREEDLSAASIPSALEEFESLKDRLPGRRGGRHLNGLGSGAVADFADLNVAGLQLLVNDLMSRIEEHNERLVELLQERDRLHMEQDSMLVDIEDLIKRCKRQAEAQGRRGAAR